jgi:hypothetical protein
MTGIQQRRRQRGNGQAAAGYSKSQNLSPHDWRVKLSPPLALYALIIAVMQVAFFAGKFFPPTGSLFRFPHLKGFG